LRAASVAKRWGWRLGMVTFVIWLGAWAWLSGFVTETIHKTEQAIYVATVDAGFSVQDILVEGRIHTDADVLRALLNTEQGDPLLAFNPSEAKEMIERIAWVKEAHVERRLPQTIYIGLQERKPLALWQHKGKVRIVDTDGETITDRKKQEFKELPIIIGANAPRHAPGLLSMVSVEPVLAERLDAASWIGDRRWDITLKSGATIKLPEQGVELALRRLVKAQKDDGLLDKRVKMIDVREADRIIVRTNPGAVQEYKANYKSGNAI
jgi:cell division protein FtsQ